MTILEAIQKGKKFKTRSGFRAKFVALLSEGIPCRLLFDVFYKKDVFAGSKYEEEFGSSTFPVLESYYLDGRYNSHQTSHMDLIVVDL